MARFPRLEISEFSRDVRRYEISGEYGEERLELFARRFTDAGLAVRRESLRREGGDMAATWEAVGSPLVHEQVTRALTTRMSPPSRRPDPRRWRRAPSSGIHILIGGRCFAPAVRGKG